MNKALAKLKSTKTNQPAKNFGGPWRVIVYTLLVFLLSQIVAALIAELLIGLTHPHTSTNLTDSIAGQFGYILLAEGLAAYGSIWLVRRRRFGLDSIGLGRWPKARDLAMAVAGFGIFWVIIIMTNLLINVWAPDLSDQKQQIGFDNLHTSTDHLLAFISLVIIPPLGEETLVRGYLYSGLRKVWRFWPALLVTSLMFGLAHLEFGTGGPLVVLAAVDTFFLSTVLVFLRERTGALYAGILVHMLNNVIAFGFHFHS